MKKFIVVALLSFITLTCGQVRAADCPVSIKYFGLNSIGSTRGLYQYAIVVWPPKFIKADNNLAPATVHLVATSHTMTRTADINVDFSHPPRMIWGTWLFLWEPNDTPTVSITAVKGADGSLVGCDAPSVSLRMGQVVQTAWHFDDSTVQLDANLRPVPVSNVKLINFAAPDYDEILKEENVQGVVLIAVVIGPGGSLLSSWVFQSSGFTLLDQRALEAARRETYTEPQVDGEPAAATFLVQYEFQLI